MSKKICKDLDKRLDKIKVKPDYQRKQRITKPKEYCYKHTKKQAKNRITKKCCICVELERRKERRNRKREEKEKRSQNNSTSINKIGN